MPQVSFVVDDATLKVIEELRTKLGVSSNAAVVRRALALTRVAVHNADADNTLTIVDPQKRSHKVILGG